MSSSSKRPPKVCHIATVDISLKNLLLNQLKSIAEDGYEVITISSPGPYTKDLEREGIRHIPVAMSRKITPFADLASLWRLYKVLKTEKVDIVHTHNPKPGLLGQLAARLAGVPVVVNTVHGFYFHDHMASWARRFYITLEKIAALCSDSILSQNRDDLATALAKRPNVTVKLGAIPIFRSAHADCTLPPTSEEVADAWRPWIEPCIEAFGPSRCMFESNFPVQRNWCSYSVVWNAFKRLASGASDSEKHQLFYGAAAAAYRMT